MSGSDEWPSDEQATTPFCSEALLDDVDAGLIDAGLLAPSGAIPGVVLQQFRALHTATRMAGEVDVRSLPETRPARSLAKAPFGRIHWLSLGAVGGLFAAAGMLLVLSFPRELNGAHRPNTLPLETAQPVRNGSDQTLKEPLIEASLVPTSPQGEPAFVQVQASRAVFVSIYSHGAGGWVLHAANIQVKGQLPVNLPPHGYDDLAVDQADIVVLVASPRRFEATSRDPRAQVAALGSTFKGELLVLRTPFN